MYCIIHNLEGVTSAVLIKRVVKIDILNYVIVDMDNDEYNVRLDTTDSEIINKFCNFNLDRCHLFQRKDGSYNGFEYREG